MRLGKFSHTGKKETGFILHILSGDHMSVFTVSAAGLSEFFLLSSQTGLNFGAALTLR